MDQKLEDLWPSFLTWFLHSVNETVEEALVGLVGRCRDGCTTSFHLGSTFSFPFAIDNAPGHRWAKGGTFTLAAQYASDERKDRCKHEIRAGESTIQHNVSPGP